MCVRVIDFAYFCDLLIWFCICSDEVVFFVAHLYRCKVISRTPRHRNLVNIICNERNIITEMRDWNNENPLPVYSCVTVPWLSFYPHSHQPRCNDRNIANAVFISGDNSFSVSMHLSSLMITTAVLYCSSQPW